MGFRGGPKTGNSGNSGNSGNRENGHFGPPKLQNRRGKPPKQGKTRGGAKTAKKREIVHFRENRAKPRVPPKTGKNGQFGPPQTPQTCTPHSCFWMSLGRGYWKQREIGCLWEGLVSCQRENEVNFGGWSKGEGNWGEIGQNWRFGWEFGGPGGGKMAKTRKLGSGGVRKYLMSRWVVVVESGGFFSDRGPPICQL